jgi:hypothetical protein
MRLRCCVVPCSMPLARVANVKPSSQAVVQDLWQPFLGLAAAWSRAKEPQLRVAAGQLYRCLFVRVDSTPHRQEVLQVRDRRRLGLSREHATGFAAATLTAAGD